MNFSAKVVAIVLLCIIVPLTITLVASYSAYRYLVIQEAKNSTKQNVDFITEYINSSFNTIYENLTVFAESNDIEKIIAVDHLSNAEQTQLQDNLVNFCYNYSVYSNAYISSNAQKSLYSAYSETKGRAKYDDVIHSDWYRDVNGTYDYAVLHYPLGSSESLSCVKVIRSTTDFQCLGYCMVKLRLSYLDSAFSLCHSSIGEFYCVTDQGRILCSTSEQVDPNIDFSALSYTPSFENIGGKITYCQKISQSNLYIVGVFPTSIHKLSVIYPFYIGLIIAVLCLAGSILVSVLMIRKFLRPIHVLAEEMEDSDLDSLKPVLLSGRKDEVGMLEEKYNEMIMRFNDMIDTQYRAVLSAQEAQLKAMQLQINPHFVNNTLQMIGGIAVEHGMMDVYDLIRSFSGMFYYCLKFKGNIVMLRDELKYLDDYIKIQQARFPNKFQYVTEIDSSTEALEIPKMALQPLMENCFVHSFSHMKSGWRISVTSHRFGDRYEVSVVDNGIGISREQIEQLQEALMHENINDPFNITTSIGLQNVNIRIKILYGDSYGLRILSPESGGTRVTLSLPAKNGDGKSNDKITDC